MNKRPVDYKQYDPKWANIPYNAPNENDKTINSSGCGPTSAAMVIASMRDPKFTPVEACAWSRAHGYKYANQGTAYSYFAPQFNAYGIKCRQLLSSRILNQPNNEIHALVKEYLEQGYWVIALMGTKADGSRGTWTTGGHYILVYDWDGKNWLINDPVHKSGSNKYSIGNDYDFRNEVRNYWLIDAREYNGKKIEPPKSVDYMAEVATKSSPLNGRVEPGGDIKRINEKNFQYPRGATVRVTKEQDNWAYTAYGILDGKTLEGDVWVDRQYLKKLDIPTGTEKPGGVTDEEIDEMDIEKLINEMTDDQAIRLFNRMDKALSKRELPKGNKTWNPAADVDRAKELGISDGSNPMGFIPRYQVMTMCARTYDKAVEASKKKGLLG